MDHQPVPPGSPALEHWAAPLAKVGWFIPPFVQMGAIDSVVKAVMTQPAFGQDDLERELAPLYRPISLAAMARLRHAQAAVIEEYAVTIEEAIEAHVLGLDHVAVAGLVPVIEGAARRLAARHGVASGQLKPVLRGLIDACKSHAVTRQLGAVGEVLSMLESFRGFLETYLYAHSETYSLADRTNRHGIAHGAYADRDYGRPLNFYKTIAAVDFLTFVSTFIGGGSWFAPAFTPRTLYSGARLARAAPGPGRAAWPRHAEGPDDRTGGTAGGGAGPERPTSR